MRRYQQANFRQVHDAINRDFILTKPYERAQWQGVEVKGKPEMKTHELHHVFIEVPVPTTNITHLAELIRPNLPWADAHFWERVSGAPINPGKEWANWPYALKADTFREEGGMFNHNYMERYWPKHAGKTQVPTETAEEWRELFVNEPPENVQAIKGIRHQYGDLSSVFTKLALDPGTRQAVLPVYFPEDTGLYNARQPCSLFYHFIMNDHGFMDVVYAMRSCDFVRHYADDVYLTVRLLLWVLERAGALNEEVQKIKPGKFIMQISNLHMFHGDWVQRFGRKEALA